MVVAAPFEKLKLTYEHRFRPLAPPHLRLREALAPTTAPCLWKVGERALIDLESRELLEQLRPGDRREAVACSRHVDQPTVPVVPEHQRVEY